jgi:hypothetical protein
MYEIKAKHKIDKDNSEFITLFVNVVGFLIHKSSVEDVDKVNISIVCNEPGIGFKQHVENGQFTEIIIKEVNNG